MRLSISNYLHLSFKVLAKGNASQRACKNWQNALASRSQAHRICKMLVEKFIGSPLYFSWGCGVNSYLEDRLNVACPLFRLLRKLIYLLVCTCRSPWVRVRQTSPCSFFMIVGGMASGCVSRIFIWSPPGFLPWRRLVQLNSSPIDELGNWCLIL